MKTILHHLFTAGTMVCAIVGMNAGNTIDIRGTEYSVDTIFHAKIGPGTTQTHLQLENAAGSLLQVHYLTVDKSTPGVSMRVVCATDKVAGTETVRKMATRKSGNGVLYFAGTNGDFFSTQGTATNGTSIVGSPTTSCFVDREIYKTSNSNYQFSIDTAGVARVGRHNYYTGTATIGDKVTLFKGVNVSVPNNGVTIFTPRYWGSSNQEEYTGTDYECTAKLVAGDNFYAGTKFRLEVTSTPDTICDLVIPSDGFVIHGRGTSTTGCNTGARNFVKGLKVGDIVEFDNVVLYNPIAGGTLNERIVPTQVVSGNPKIVGEGQTLDTESERTDASALHPRTGIGYSQSGDSIIMMVIDGRYAYSAGVRTSQLADVMRYAGAYEAVNLDGGGSSTLYTAALGVRNHPSDGNERADGNAIFATVEAPEDNEITEIQFKDWRMIFPKYGIYTPTIFGYNKYGVLVDTDVKGYTLTCPEELGTITEGGSTFLGDGNGTHALTATYNGLTAAIPVTIDASNPPELTHTKVLLDNYREWNVEIRSLVLGEYMSVDPKALSWTSSEESVASVDANSGLVKGLKDGNTIVTGTVDDFTGAVDITVECPTDRVMAIDKNLDASSWTFAKGGVKNATLSNSDKGVAFDFTVSSTRSTYVKMSKDSLRIWSLPDAIRVRFIQSDSIVSKITIGSQPNNDRLLNREITPELKVGVENIVDLPVSEIADINNIGIYPITLSSIRFDLGPTMVTTGTTYKIEVTGIEAVYNNAPVGIEDVESDNIEKAELTIADGTISATSVAESIEIYNLAGQLISVAKDTQHIASPSAGSYIVKVTIDGKTSASKVIL